MKRARLEAVLRRKIRVQITRRQRGRFTVHFPLMFDSEALESAPHCFTKRDFSTKREALTFLLVKLRCMNQFVVSVTGKPK